jgi:hypothetical protein
VIVARRTSGVIDVTEILVHWHAGRSLNEMSQSLGVDRKTIRKYARPRWLRQVTRLVIAAHHDYIVAQVKAGVRMPAAHQRLRDGHGLAASVASFRRYAAANVPEEGRRSQVTVWGPRQAEAGEQAQPAGEHPRLPQCDKSAGQARFLGGRGAECSDAEDLVELPLDQLNR